MTPGALVVDDLHVAYQGARGAVSAVRGVTFAMNPGEFFAQLGASGCAKTTAVAVVCRLEATRISGERRDGANVMQGRVTAAVFAGDQMTYCIDVGDHVLQARGKPDSVVREGDYVYIQLPPTIVASSAASSGTTSSVKL